MAKEFEKAVGAVVSGDTETLESLLSREPDLIRMRSSRAHGAMLIHFANKATGDDKVNDMLRKRGVISPTLPDL